MGQGLGAGAGRVRQHRPARALCCELGAGASCGRLRLATAATEPPPAPPPAAPPPLQAVIAWAEHEMSKADPRFPVGRARLEALGVLACACIMSVSAFQVGVLGLGAGAGAGGAGRRRG